MHEFMDEHVEESEPGDFSGDRERCDWKRRVVELSELVFVASLDWIDRDRADNRTITLQVHGESPERHVTTYCSHG